MLAVLVFVLSLITSMARADWQPPLNPGMSPQSVSVLTEQNQKQDLRWFLYDSSPILLVPIFTQCQGTCPLTVHGLKKALAGYGAGTPFRVVLFDFDATDTAQDLRNYRQMKELPPDWILVRALDEGSARSYFDQFSFNFMRAEGGFNHPNELFVLSGHGLWSGTLAGNDNSETILKTAYREAMALDTPSPWSRLISAIKRPENWAIFGAFGFLAGLAVIAVVIK